MFPVSGSAAILSAPRCFGMAAEAGHFAPEDEMDEFYRLHRNP
jgi:hypothetical protein